MTTKYFIQANIDNKIMKLCSVTDVVAMFTNFDSPIIYFDTRQEAIEWWEEKGEYILSITKGNISDISIIEHRENVIYSLNKEKGIDEILFKKASEIRYDTTDITVKQLIDEVDIQADFLNLMTDHILKQLEFILIKYPMETVDIREDKLYCSIDPLIYFIKLFIDNKIQLKGLIVEELKDMYFKDLPIRIQNSFLNYTFRVRVFTKDSPMYLYYYKFIKERI